jgi:hypothetical protein
MKRTRTSDLGNLITAPLLCAGFMLSIAPSLRAAEPLPQQTRATLEKATAFMRSIATEGGYLWWYSEDLQER